MGPDDDTDGGSETETLGVKVTPEEKTEVRVAAAQRNMNMSDWLREAVDEKLERESSGNPKALAATPSS